ncbi:hypothetical protein GH714_040810 [Hevea brasiliensis]|uniref:Uncharacterized protein n=1 Tax=Hevea brasiliensis TaxID=3981 RepID=A0A6A6MTW4_HEVBR|nr:hypothetical protein GH714_040810 [Hevea brasiliensis]
MVAISLYRGNLHRVPDVPRRWPMPVRKISLKDFKSLLHRRSKALSRLRSSTNAIATTSNHNPKTDPKENVDPIALNLEAGEGTNREEEEGTSKGSASKEVKDQKGLDFGECSVKPEGLSDLSPAEKGDDEAVNADGNFQPEKLDLSANPNTEILNVEEELKRRNSMQGMGIRPSVPLQGDIANDSGSMSRHNTPRMGSEGNLGGDMEGGETEDVSNPSNHSRHIQRMSSTSPSSESPLRKPPYIQHNVVPYPSRPSLGTISSPSRFAPTGHQVPSANVPMVSVSGTNYIASSPSPAASGGTSAFRDARQPSPWN